MESIECCYTTEDVARRYRCSTVTVARWVRSGRITAINTGGNRNGPYVFRKEDLNTFEQRSEVGKIKGDV